MLSFELTFHFCHQSQFHRAKETSYVTFLFTINYHTLSNSCEDHLIFNSTNDISYERKHKFQLSVVFLGERVRDTPNLNPVNSQWNLQYQFSMFFVSSETVGVYPRLPLVLSERSQLFAVRSKGFYTKKTLLEVLRHRSISLVTLEQAHVILPRVNHM
jgi:hypothetical protein